MPKPPATEQHVTAADAGQRLDRWLKKLLRTMPAGAIFRHLRQGAIRVDGAKAEPSLRLAEGMVIELRLPQADQVAVQAATPRRSPGPTPVARPQRDPDADRRSNSKEAASGFQGQAPRIVYRDEHLLIVDKPAGLAAQPGSGTERNNLVAWLDTELRGGARSATFAPSPAHRIDRGTSGLVIVGLTPQGLRGMTESFREDRVQKQYLAVVHGVPAKSGSIDAPLREVDAERGDQPKVVVDPRGKVAHTEFTVLEVRGDRALLAVRIATGRMHQIRAHLAHLGHPIVGDRRYGSPVRMGYAFLLHAGALRFAHPLTGAEMVVEAETPKAFKWPRPAR